MNYITHFLEDMTIEEIDEELSEMWENQYKLGDPIDKPRMWNLMHTKEILENMKGAKK